MKTALATAFVLAASTAFAQYSIPGAADPWLAGAADGITASGGDVAPGQSPVLVSGITGGWSYNFTVSGLVDNGGGNVALSPDGASFIGHSAGAENGISNLNAPINSLIGVFLNDATPTTPGASLDFQTLGIDFASFAPDLNQAFFIGDGLNSLAAQQTFVAPTGATRLFLGTMDGYQWSNNTGAFSVTVAAIPEPSTYAVLLGAATLAVVAYRRRRQA